MIIDSVVFNSLFLLSFVGKCCLSCPSIGHDFPITTIFFSFVVISKKLSRIKCIWDNWNSLQHSFEQPHPSSVNLVRSLSSLISSSLSVAAGCTKVISFSVGINSISCSSSWSLSSIIISPCCSSSSSSLSSSLSSLFS